MARSVTLVACHAPVFSPVLLAWTPQTLVLCALPSFPEVSPPSVEELRQQKAFVKLLKKQYRELKELRRKHMKKICSLNKKQSTQLTLERSRLRSREG